MQATNATESNTRAGVTRVPDRCALPTCKLFVHVPEQQLCNKADVEAKAAQADTSQGQMRGNERMMLVIRP